MIKKYLWVLIFNILTAAIIFVPVGLYIYFKFGFTSEFVHVGTKASVIGIAFFAVFGLYLLSTVKKHLKGIRHWIVRYVLLTLYYVVLAAACVYLIGKLCDTVTALADTALKSISELTKAISYTSMLFLSCFVVSRVPACFAALFKSRIDDLETLKATERAMKTRAREKKKKGKTREVYLND